MATYQVRRCNLMILKLLSSRQVTLKKLRQKQKLEERAGEREEVLKARVGKEAAITPRRELLGRTNAPL